jgi:hypothetical protein
VARRRSVCGKPDLERRALHCRTDKRSRRDTEGRCRDDAWQVCRRKRNTGFGEGRSDLGGPWSPLKLGLRLAQRQRPASKARPRLPRSGRARRRRRRPPPRSHAPRLAILWYESWAGAAHPPAFAPPRELADGKPSACQSDSIKSCGPSGSQGLALLAEQGRRPPPFLRGGEPLPWNLGGNRWQSTATVLVCLSRFGPGRICHRLPLVAPARLHKGSILRCLR